MFELWLCENGNFETDIDSKQTENDWIIFKIAHANQYFIPKIFEIKNHTNEYAVKSVDLYSGNEEKRVWLKLNTIEMSVSNNNMFGNLDFI